jgi:hypothetical protein
MSRKCREFAAVPSALMFVVASRETFEVQFSCLLTYDEHSLSLKHKQICSTQSSGEET